MNIPGFTAEASLGKTKDTYELTLRHIEASGMVLPQALCYTCGFDINGHWECYWHQCFIRTHV